MRKVVYDFAMTVDGFICRPDGSIDDFPGHGPHVDDYLKRLESYDTVLMGRRTYELGYKYGLVPGDRAYPHMDHYVFSTTLRFDRDHRLNIVADGAADTVKALKAGEGAAIYICGDSSLAGFLLESQLIDELIVKLNPVVLGRGLEPFAASSNRARLQRVDNKSYPNGVVLLQYALRYE